MPCACLLLHRGEPGFPPRLDPIPDAPARLWIRGDPTRIPTGTTRSLAIVGTRAASRDGLTIAAALAGDLTRAGITIVSGLARGIDAAAHRAALDAGGNTIAVLGSGLNRVYPPEHDSLASEIAARGAVVSEYPPDTAPFPGTFPRRNRLISGLADAVVVVEAPERSGALITASAALNQGKDVLVVPGRVVGRRNSGGHALIRDGAGLVETAADILFEMGWTPPARRLGTPLSPQAKEDEEFTLDEEALRTGEAASAVLTRLMQQELAGEIQRVGSGRFVRVRARANVNVQSTPWRNR